MFLTNPALRRARSGYFELLEPLVWKDRVTRIEVPAGFVTDFDSVPPIARGLLKHNGNALRPSILHDWLYRTRPASRRYADEIFRAALAAEGVHPVGRQIYWWGVRTGGWLTWRKPHRGVTR